MALVLEPFGDHMRSPSLSRSCARFVSNPAVRRVRLGAIALAAAALFALSGCGPTVELSGVAFGVAFTSPSGGGEDISTEVLPRVGFSRAVDTAASLDLIHLELDADGTDVPATLLFVDDSKTVVIAPRIFLEPNADYAIVIPADTPSADGVSVGVDVRAVFTTGDDED